MFLWNAGNTLAFSVSHTFTLFLLNTPIFSVKTKSFLDTPTASDAWRIFSDEKKRSQSICVHRPCLLWASHEEPRVWGEGKALVIPSICGLGDEWLFTPALKQLARPRDILSLAHLYRQQPLQIRFQRCAVAYDFIVRAYIQHACIWSPSVELLTHFSIIERDSSPKNDHSVIIYSLSCHSKPGRYFERYFENCFVLKVSEAQTTLDFNWIEQKK